MLSLTSILAPVDFSERSLASARYAKSLADRFQACLTVLYAECSEPAPANWREILDGELAGARRLIVRGDPAHVIPSWANEHQVDLIVMATYGKGGFRRFALGSVAEQVLRAAECPVWTGADLEGAVPQTLASGSTVVCALDLGPQSSRALEWAAGLTGHLNAGLVVVHAAPVLAARNGGYCDPQWRIRLENEALERVEELLRQVGVRAEVLAVCGDPPAVVRGATVRYRAALLVIGRGSARGMHGRLRANAYAILKESPCPVVSV